MARERAAANNIYIERSEVDQIFEKDISESSKRGLDLYQMVRGVYRVL